MKGLSIFFDSKKIRIHPNAYTDNGFGRAIPPFLTLHANISNEEFRANIQETLTHSKSGVPFKMPSGQEVKAYFEALGVHSNRQLGIGVHIIVEDEVYTVTPVNKRGMFGQAEKVEEEDLLGVIKELLGLVEKEAAG